MPRKSITSAVCLHCGKTFSVTNIYLANKFCGNPCRYAHKRGPEGAHWKGGQPVTGNGYVREYCPDHPGADPDGYVLQHRVVAERMLGRYLQKEEHVHHIDRNKKNNHPSNLQVLSSLEHVRLHAREDRERRLSSGTEDPEQSNRPELSCLETSSRP